MASLAVLFVMLALMWALVILPQQRKVKAHRAFVDQLSIGDEVVTTAGIHGTITDLSADRVRLEIADGVEITMARIAVGHSQHPDSPDEPDAVDAAPTDADEPAAEAETAAPDDETRE